MDNFDSLYYDTKLGMTKDISKPDNDGFIIKKFKTKKQILPIEQQRKIIKGKKAYFGEYIPETYLVEIGNREYIIKQKFIKGKTLAEINLESLSTETLAKLVDLIKKYIKYHKEQGGDMDITGCQFYEGNPNPLLRKIKNFLKINQNFLVFTNIMISNDGHVYMVDVCESTDIRLQGKFKNFCAKPFIKRTISRLEKILQQKREYGEYKSELFSTISSQT